MAAVPENRIKNAPQARRAAAKKSAQKVAGMAKAEATAKAGPMSYALLADTLALGAGTAEYDWGWKKGPKSGTWIDGAGNTVVFAAHAKALDKLAEAGPVGVYEGYRWYAAIAPHHLEEMIHAGKVIKLPHGAPDKAS